MIRARDLLNISHTAILPLPFVKVFIVNGKRVLDKGKTGHARRTLDPLFQQHLTFRKGLQGSIMQVKHLISNLQKFQICIIIFY